MFWDAALFITQPSPITSLQTRSLTRAVLGWDSSEWTLHPFQLISCFFHECMYLYVWEGLDCWGFGARFLIVKLTGYWFCYQGSTHISWNSGWQWISASHSFKTMPGRLSSVGWGLTGSAKLSLCLYLPLPTPDFCSNGHEGLTEQRKDGIINQ